MSVDIRDLKILHMNIESAKVKELRVAIKEAKAESGTNKMKKADLVAYAMKVAAIRQDNYFGEINPENVDHLMDVDELPCDGNVFASGVSFEDRLKDAVHVATVTIDGEKATEVWKVPKEDLVKDNPPADPQTAELTLDELRERVQKLLGDRKKGGPKGVRKLNDRFVDLFKATIKDATPDENGVIVVTGDMIKAAGWSPTYSQITNGWTRTKTAGRAALVCGFSTKTKRVENGFVVICTPVQENVAEHTPQASS